MEHKGTVYFFTGLSGAGKTTVGSLFYRRLKNTKPNAVYLDGDEIRVAFGEDVGYTNDERLRWAGRIFRVCRLLSDQGIDVVCCSIAMYQSVRAWNRANIPNYKEIYLRVKPETLLARNQKGLYTGGHNVVGVDLPFDEPKTPDLIIQNDGERTPLEAVEEIERENILGATRLAFARAVEQLPPPFTLYTDYITGLNIPVPYTPIIKGDAKVYSIAAASILAKVMRDRMMRAYAEEYPEYGFEKNKGYGSADHREALQKYGPCPIHRRTFIHNWVKQ